MTRRSCAVAHDVREALGGWGNVDHVVMTPAGIWVVETKSHRLSKRRFPRALRQVAENASRVRRHLETSLPVRGALVIADRSEDSLESQFNWNGEPVQAFGPTKFLRVLSAEREQAGADARSPEMARVERAVWGPWLHAIPGIVTGPAGLPRRAPGFATKKRIETEVAATNCHRGSTTTHRGMCSTRPRS